MDVGDVEFWDSKPFIDAANILVAADEPLRALQLLDLVPGYKRDHIDKDIEELRRKIKSKLVTSVWYGDCHATILDKESSVNLCQQTLRGQMMIRELNELNKLGITPHIIEFAAGEYWIPIALQEMGYKFTYESICLNKEAKNKAKEIIPWSEDRKNKLNIYIAFEIIEHLHFEQDIAVEIERLGVKPDIIHLSTPLYSFDGRKESLNWQNKDLGHIRTYTPREFYDVSMAMFHGYKIELQVSQVMHVRGTLNLYKTP